MTCAHDNHATFVPLFNGDEPSGAAQKRRDILQVLWTNHGRSIDQIIKHVDLASLSSIAHYVKQVSSTTKECRIPTGLVITGPNYSIQERLLEFWKSHQVSQSSEEVITLDSSQAPNLTTALKNVIKSVIIQRNGLEWYQSFLQDHKKLIPMSYDLELLRTFVEQENVTKIVISILDVEVFDVGSLAELISALSSWIDRLPIVLLFGIATTTELFEARLPKTITRLLDGKAFDISPRNDTFHNVYQCVQNDPGTKLWLGPGLSSVLLGRSQDQDESPDSFARSLHYIYMSHFFANPLSVLLEEGQYEGARPTTELCAAIRNTDSFRNNAERLLDAKNVKVARRLLNEDEYLLEECKKAVAAGQQSMSAYRRAVQIFGQLHGALQHTADSGLPAFDVDVQAFSGIEFLESELYNNTLVAIEKLPSDKLEHLLTKYPMLDLNKDSVATSTLTTIHSLHKASSGLPVRSAHDPGHTTTSTTISRNNTVSLSKHAPKLSKIEKDYTRLVDQVCTTLNEYFEANVIDFTQLFMHEVFVYDLKMPLSGAFTPRPRYAIERAFNRPGDYLGCDCCRPGDADGCRSGMQPSTSLLWQLWCEAGSIVNVRDLWEAFDAAVVEREETEDDEEEVEDGEPKRAANGGRNSTETGIDERMALALFYRSLAELRMLGFVKPTKKKVDCLAKVTWKGL